MVRFACRRVPYTHRSAGGITASKSWRTVDADPAPSGVEVVACAPTDVTHWAKVVPLGKVVSMYASWSGGESCIGFQVAVP